MFKGLQLGAFLLLLATAGAWENSWAEDLDLGALDLSDLLNIKTSVATKKEVSARATPGIISIITDEEIRNLGARDLIDVLSLIPSLSFGNDVQGVVGLGIRGMWAHEGKFLLIVDGIEMNEIQYASTHFGNEFPVNQIKRIEVIRGPGSAIYGGFAELAVVNIITKKGADYKGAQADAMMGRMAKGSQRNNFGLAYGNNRGDWDYSVAGYAGKGKRGEGDYTGFHPGPPTLTGSYDYKDADTLDPGFVTAGLSGHGANLRFVYENYRVGTRSQYDFSGSDEVIPNQFRSYNGLASYEFHPSEKVKITPSIQYNYQIPWQEVSDLARELSKTYNIHSQRVKAGTFVSYDMNSQVNVLGGFEYIADHHNIVDQSSLAGPVPFRSGKTEANFDSRALVGQVLYDAGFANFAAGARYEAPGFTQASFVPRFGVTKAEKDWHAKLLYAQAFRTPVLFNIDPRPGIRPEKTETTELELGHSVTAASYVTFNIFNTKIKNPIVYYYDNTLGDQYDNFGEVGTRGVELDYRLKKPWGQVQLGYSYYEVNTNNVDRYRVDGNDKALVGMPQNKLVWNSWFNLGAHGFKLNPSIVYIDQVYAYEFDGNSTMVLNKLPATTLASLFLSRDDVGFKGLNLGAGLFNLFNNQTHFVQPYNGGHSPAPGPSREAALRLEYNHDF